MIQNELQADRPYRVSLCTSIPSSVYYRLRAAALAEKRSLSNKIMQIVTEYFEREEKKMESEEDAVFIRDAIAREKILRERMNQNREEEVSVESGNQAII